MAIQNIVILTYFLITFANCVTPLPVVTGLRLTYLEPGGVFVQWDVPYEYVNNISGYKVKIWSLEEKTTRNYKLLNGDQYPGLERNDVAQEEYNTEYISKSNVSEITTKNPYHVEARLLDNYINVEKLYEIRVLAYKGEEMGPMTDPVRLKILKSKTDYTMSDKVVKPRPTYRVLTQRRLDSCSISVITNTTDGEPYVHNTYL